MTKMKPRIEIIKDDPYTGITTLRVKVAEGTWEHIEFARNPDDIQSWLVERGVIVPAEEVSS